jgi:serine/threonine protein kinase/TolB-like protein
MILAMDRSRWDSIQALFHEAAERPAAEQRQFLDERCPGDADLVAQVLAMLEEDARTTLLDHDVAHLAGDLIGTLKPAGIDSDQFLPYRLKAPIGEGGMGVVYLAERPDLGSVVAIKILRDGWLSPARRRRFAEEQRTLARLNHPGIARLYDAHTTADGTPWLVMEYVDGVPLTDYCEAQRSSVAERLRLFRAVCEAVGHAHQHGIVHRDLKPSNILVKQDGTVRLLDFGVSKVLDGADPGRHHTTVRLMTPAYAAPEHLRGEPSAIHTDIYSLGVILYELLTGRLPFDAGGPGGSPSLGGRLPLFEAMSDPVPPSAADRSSSGGDRGVVADAASWSDLDVLCLTAMHIDAGRRYQSVTALSDDVDRFLTSQPLVARPDSVTYRLRKFARRNRQALVASMAAVVVAGGLALGVSLAVGLRVFQTASAAASAGPRAKAIAVLPFQNVAADDAIDFLRLALPDEIATALSRIPDLAVRPTTATSRYTDASRDPRQAGRDLQADSVVTGRFVRAGEQLHITLEASDVKSNRILWRDDIQAPAQSMIATQIQIALRVREGLAPVLGVTMTGRIARPTNEEAYNLFLRSAAVPFGTSQNAEALALLERSVELDPAYVPAWHALARRYYGESRFGSGAPAMMGKWELAVKRVLELDPDNVPIAGGYLRGRIERGELASAYREAEDLVRRFPNSVDAHFTLSYALRYAGLLQESARHCETALVLDEGTQTSGLRSCAIVFIRLGDYPRALNFLHLDPVSGFTKALTIDLLLREGREDDALRVGSPGLPQWVSSDMLLACVQRRPQGELRALADGVRPSEDPEINYLFAGHLSYCGQSEAALAMLRRAIEGGYCSYPAVDTDPFFARLRGAPEFASIRSKAVACHEAFRAQQTPSAH